MKTKHIASAGMGLITLAAHTSADMVGHEKYTYDAAGNIVEKQIDGEVTRFDAVGNLLKADDRGTTYLHDSAGRLIGESRSGVLLRNLDYQYGDKITRVNNGEIKTKLLYNAEGHLIGVSADGRMKTLAWDGLCLSAHDDNAFVTESGFQGGTPLFDSEMNEIIVSDYLGNTLQKGTKYFHSTVYGEQLEEVWFTGKPYIPELGGYAFKHRTYSPVNGRWLTLDPLGFPDGPNAYSYLMNPNSGADPYGTKVEEISNTVSSPDTSSGSLAAPAPINGSVSWTASGSKHQPPAVGFKASLSHTSTHVDAPSPSEVSVNVTITADDENEIIFYTPLANPYQATGAGGTMGITAKMSPNGKETISANVTGGIAFNPLTLSGVAGVTDTPNAPNVSLSGSGGAGVALQFGGGSWKWVEN